MIKSEKVTRLEAAKRQLDQAIRLFFGRQDTISIHTLAAASLEILRNIAKRKGVKRMIDSQMDVIKPEYHKTWWKLMREAQGFFKHADQGPVEHSIVFRPEVTKFFILEAVFLYRDLTGNYFPSANAFWVWFMVKHPELILPEAREKAKELSWSIDPDDYTDFEDFIRIQETGSARK